MSGALPGPTFTILLPVHRPPDLLSLAVDTVLAQERADWELFVICDGAPSGTVETARRLAARDPRIRAFVFPKGERHGEAWRDRALREARGRHVAQINDDDLWFPDHLQEMDALLREVDFGNLLHTLIDQTGAPRCLPGDLRDAPMRRRMLAQKFNFFGPTAAGYRLDAYRRLPVGWSPAPPDVWTDLHMWRKFLAARWCRCATRFAVTSLHFDDPGRDALGPEAQAADSRRWRLRIADPRGRQALEETARRRFPAEHAALRRENEKLDRRSRLTPAGLARRFSRFVRRDLLGRGRHA